jgi:hypothetical protein
MKVFNGFPATMPNTLRQAGRLSPEEATVEWLLSGGPACPDAPTAHQAVALVLQAASQPPSERELTGEDAAVAAFLAAIGPPGPSAVQARTVSAASSWPHARLTGGTARWLPMRTRGGPRSPSFTRRLVLLAAACLVATTLALGGTAAASGRLPVPLQDVAHTVFGAPAPRPPGPRPPASRPPGPRPPASRPAVEPSDGRPAPAGRSRGQAIVAIHRSGSHKTSTASPGTRRAKVHKNTKKTKGKAHTKGHPKRSGNGNGKKKDHAKGRRHLSMA